MRFWIFILTTLLFAAPASASNRQLVHQGRIVRPDGVPLQGSFLVEAKVYSPADSNCLLWAEAKMVDFTLGTFSYDVGDATKRLAGAGGGAAIDFPRAFINDAANGITGAVCEFGSTYTPGSADERRLEITLYDGPLLVKAYDDVVRSVPYALDATNATMVGGYGARQLFKVNATTADEAALTFSTLGASLIWQFAETATPDLRGKLLKNLASPVDAQDAATRKYVLDTVAAAAAGSLSIGVTNVGAVSASTGVMTVSGGPITSTGTFSFAFVSQAMGTFFAAPAGVGGVPAFRGIVASDIPAIDAAKITTGTLPVSLGGTGLASFTPYAIMAANMSGTALEQRTCVAGEVLEWQTGMGFVCVARLSSAGGVTNVTAGAGLLGGSITAAGTLAVDVGSTSGKIVAVGPGDKIPIALVPTLNLSNLGGTAGVSLDGTLGTSFGGTGLNTSTAANGQLLIGNGTGFSLATLTAGTGISIINTAGAISISAAGGSTGSSQWTTGTAGISYAGGQVGIGTANPTAPLDVFGPNGRSLKVLDPPSASSANYLTISGSTTGVAPVISSAGSDTFGNGLGLTLLAASTTAPGAGGPIIITAGNGGLPTGNGLGGSIGISAGAARNGSSSAGGAITIVAGSGGGPGGNLTMIGGNGTTTAGPGGNVFCGAAAAGAR